MKTSFGCRSALRQAPFNQSGKRSQAAKAGFVNRRKSVDLGLGLKSDIAGLKAVTGMVALLRVF